MTYQLPSVCILHGSTLSEIGCYIQAYGLISPFQYWLAGETHWCRDAEILQSEEGLLFCPSVDDVILRVSQDNIIFIENIPVPGGWMHGNVFVCVGYAEYVGDVCSFIEFCIKGIKFNGVKNVQIGTY